MAKNLKLKVKNAQIAEQISKALKSGLKVRIQKDNKKDDDVQDVVELEKESVDTRSEVSVERVESVSSSDEQSVIKEQVISQSDNDNSVRVSTTSFRQQFTQTKSPSGAAVRSGPGFSRFSPSSQLFSAKVKPESKKRVSKYTSKKEDVVLPPGFESTSSEYKTPSWVKELDSSRAKLGPTGKHINDMTVAVKAKPIITDGQSTFQRPVHARRPVSLKSGFSKGPSIFESASKIGESKIRHSSFFMETAHDVSDKPAARNVKSDKPWNDSEYSGDGDGGQKGFKKKQVDRSKKSKPDKSFSQRGRKKSVKDKVAQSSDSSVPKELKINLPVAVKDLASAMKLRVDQIIANMFLHGIVVKHDGVIDQVNMAVLIGDEFGCKIHAENVEDSLCKVCSCSLSDELSNTDPSSLKSRPPVVTFMGHVDHGKTSLIDAIRNSRMANSEAGNITQNIGAFKCNVGGSSVTVIDVPGHQAFEHMRSRGASITDISVIVIAGDEGIKPQTEESIKSSKEAGCSIIVALNKCDRPGFDCEKVYRQLSEICLLPEAWGGSVVTVSCSAVTKEGIDELLEVIVLQSQLLDLKADPSVRARGFVIESGVDKGLGPCATVVVQNGTLRVGDAFVVGQHCGRVRIMKNDLPGKVTSAVPSDAVVIYGLSSSPCVGEELVVVKDEQTAKNIVDARSKSVSGYIIPQVTSVEELVAVTSAPSKQKFRIIIRGGALGAVEALGIALKAVPSDRVELEILSQSVGHITESIVNLASAAKAIVVGFQTVVDSRAKLMSKNLGVSIHVYDIIYHAVDQITELMRASLCKIVFEKASGVAEVRAVFKSSKFGTIAGCMVIDGILKRQQMVRVIRCEQVIQTGKIVSMRSGQDDVKESLKGFECGIVMDNFEKFEIGDQLHSHDVVYLSQGLTACEDEKSV